MHRQQQAAQQCSTRKTLVFQAEETPNETKKIKYFTLVTVVWVLYEKSSCHTSSTSYMHRSRLAEAVGIDAHRPKWHHDKNTVQQSGGEEAEGGGGWKQEPYQQLLDAHTQSHTPVSYPRPLSQSPLSP